jgi:hypothetical protein
MIHDEKMIRINPKTFNEQTWDLEGLREGLSKYTRAL